MEYVGVCAQPGVEMDVWKLVELIPQIQNIQLKILLYITWTPTHNNSHFSCHLDLLAVKALKSFC
jgi:hypothetical protein